MKLSVCVLLYGPYLNLAERCLGSIAREITKRDRGDHVVDVKIALNDVCMSTYCYTTSVAENLANIVPVSLFITVGNVSKYPLMRRMIHDNATPGAGIVTWFDDDSFIQDEYVANSDHSWFREVVVALDQADIIGDKCFLPGGYRPGQAEGIMAQPWYKGKPIPKRNHPRFITGGWWAAKYAFLAKANWPFPEIDHNGGDTILGEYIYQQGGRMVDWAEGVSVNCKESGADNSTAPRRGKESRWPYEGYNPGDTINLTHQNFRYKLIRYEVKR